MKVEQGFYTKDLNVYLNRSENLGDTPVYTKEYFMQRFKYYNNSYKIFYAFDGEFTLTNGNCERTVKANTLSFASPFENFTFKPDFNKEFKFIFITLHPSVFTNKSIESTYFRIFENLKNESAYLDIADLGMSVLSDTLGLLADLVLKSYGRCHIESVCLSIITQMSMFYDAHHKPDVIARSLPKKLPKFMQRPEPQNEEEMVEENFRSILKRILLYNEFNQQNKNLNDFEYVLLNIPERFAFLVDRLSNDEQNKVTFRRVDSSVFADSVGALDLAGALYMKSYNTENNF